MKAVLLNWRELTSEVHHFEFEVPEVETLTFEPGQFISIVENIEGEEITRAYSIASRPECNRFSLCLNLVPGGHMSPVLFGLRPGHAIDFRGPLGMFTARHTGRDRLLVATGTGIAPFRSMMAHHWATRAPEHITLLFGIRYPETILYREELERWQREHQNFRFLPTLSRAPEDWTGLRGHVQEHLADAVGDRRDIDVYICGLKAMVDDVRARCKAMGFDRRQIVTEKYD